jgi:hypothetical protein
MIVSKPNEKILPRRLKLKRWPRRVPLPAPRAPVGVGRSMWRSVGAAMRSGGGVLEWGMSRGRGGAWTAEAVRSLGMTRRFRARQVVMSGDD